MSESRGGHPIQVALVVLMIVAGGWYFFRNYKVSGLDGVSVYPKDSLGDDDLFASYGNAPLSLASITSAADADYQTESPAENPFKLIRSSSGKPDRNSVRSQRQRFRKLRIASWALDGYGPTKFANRQARKQLVNVVRQFDIVAIQQIASVERDLVPRLVDSINQGDPRYDYVIGTTSGPRGRQEQLVFIFDRQKVVVDRQQTYTVDDPEGQLTYDPLVAWFRAAEPDPSIAWTFSLVNVRVDLARAPAEVALLSAMLTAIRQDGRGEDDVVLAGLFQADDAYLLPSLGTDQAVAAIRNHPTDIFGQYQTCNILLDAATTSEYLGGGGVYDFQRQQNLSVAEAEMVTSHLPVYAEFTATEGGQL